ncbi:hypothetical protein U9M48_045088 [Paspalum notatum var. saurae]|uniref:Uncharacterized protein n=1 Tax=Paspalum notatum var. saurae TaxID=547442 RepID=A0AAQ3V174_PASNO
MLSLGLMGLLLLGHLTAGTDASADHIHLNSVDRSGDAPTTEAEGRVVYADMMTVKTKSGGSSEAPAPGPSTTS